MMTMTFKKQIGGLLLLTSALGLNAQTQEIISDFNNGSLQGWQTSNPLTGQGFNGQLGISSAGGNPGGYLFANDTRSGGGSLAVRAPAPLIGNLAELGELEWDVLLPSSSGLSTSALIQGFDGTLYRSENSRNGSQPIGQWFTKSISFESSAGWTRIRGSSSFATVAANAQALYIELDVTTRLGREAGIDNVRIPYTPPQDDSCGTRPPRPEAIYSEFIAPVPPGYVEGNLGGNKVCTGTIGNDLSVPLDLCVDSYTWSMTPTNSRNQIYPSGPSATVGVQDPGRYTIILRSANAFGQRIEQFLLDAENCSGLGGSPLF